MGVETYNILLIVDYFYRDGLGIAGGAAALGLAALAGYAWYSSSTKPTNEVILIYSSIAIHTLLEYSHCRCCVINYFSVACTFNM